jgi:hypothetical protein
MFIGMSCRIGCTQLGPLYALDSLSTPAATAFSTRRLSVNYTGPALRVRRSSDNVELDIGFTASGALDTAALLTHVGGGSGFVTTWYDQSGNGRDVTQSAAANQPRIVNAGVVDTRNGRPAVRFLGGSQETLRHTAATTVYAGTISAAMVFQMNTTTPAFARILTHRRTAGGFDWGTIGSATFSRSGSAGAVEIFSANAQRSVRAFVLDVLNQSSVQIGPSTFIGVNGSLSATGVTPDLNSDILEIGATPQANAIDGFMPEVITFTTPISTADRQLLERSQGAYYGITIVP